MHNESSVLLQRYTGVIEDILALRAVVFDYGMVLTGPPDPQAYASLVRITGLSAARLDSLYWSHRAAYDEGELTGEAFWRKVIDEAGLHLSELEIRDLVHHDVRMWMTENRAMLAWQLRLKERGLMTAIVSNMGDTVHKQMEQELEWLSRFDVLVWSYQLHMTKPHPGIYRYVLERLGRSAGEVLFIDDRPANIDAAVGLGMKGLVFSTVEQLRSDLKESGLDSELPLP